MYGAIYKAGDWQFAWFWTIVPVSAFVGAATIAFIIGDMVGRTYP